VADPAGKPAVTDKKVVFEIPIAREGETVEQWAARTAKDLKRMMDEVRKES